MVDVFEEVEEQLRSDRYRTLFRKGWPYALGLVVIVLVAFGGVWGYREYQESQSARASEAYAAASQAATSGDLANAEKQLTELSRSGPAAYRALALMQIAGFRVRENKTAEAVQLLDQAADVAPEALIADAARLKAAYLVFDTASLEDLRGRLDPLAEAGRPYVALAREAVAMKQLAAGRTAEARTTLSALTLLPDASDDLRTRVQAAVALIDSGTAPVVAKTAAAAAALPPAPAASPAAVGAAGSPPAGAAPAPAAPAEAGR